MKTNKFLKLSQVKILKDSELQNVKGGILVDKIIIEPLYGIKQLYGIDPIQLYGIKI